MIHAIVLEFPGREHRFEWLPGDTIPDEHALAVRAINALEVFADVAQPLSADLSLQCIDRTTRFAAGGERPARPFHHLRSAALSSGTGRVPLFADAVVTTVPMLRPAALRHWIGAALASADCSPGLAAGWESLRVDATRAHLEPTAGAPLRLKHVGGETADLALEQDATGMWASGPIEAFPDQPPIAFAMQNEGGALWLTVAVHWSPWSDDGAPGARSLATAFARLRSLGWSLVVGD